jgi:hypothetical protein
MILVNSGHLTVILINPGLLPLATLRSDFVVAHSTAILLTHCYIIFFCFSLLSLILYDENGFYQSAYLSRVSSLFETSHNR